MQNNSKINVCISVYSSRTDILKIHELESLLKGNVDMILRIFMNEKHKNMRELGVGNINRKKSVFFIPRISHNIQASEQIPYLLQTTEQGT